MEEDLFQRARVQRYAGLVEFQLFREQATQQVALGFLARNRRFNFLRKLYGFHRGTEHPDLVEFRFGSLIINQKAVSGNIAVEEGPTLNYAVGPQGHIITTLYPAKSELGKPYEDAIFIRAGQYTAHMLSKKFEGDLNALVAYFHVTCIYGVPTSSERLRVWWLRRFHPMILDKKYTPPKIFKYQAPALRFTLTTAFLLFLKPLAVLILISILIYFGLSNLATLVRP